MNIKALETLEYNKIKISLAEFAISELGKEMIMKLKPSTDQQKIKRQLKEVTEVREILQTATSIPIQNLAGIDSILDKLEKDIVLTAEDFSHLGFFIGGIQKVKDFMGSKEFIAPQISNYAYSMYNLEDVYQEIDRCIYRNNINDNASSNLERIRKEIYVVEGRLKSKLETILQSPHYRPYLQDNFISQKNGRYVISVKSQYKKKIKGSIVETSSTGSTVFIEPAPISKLRSQLDGLKIEEKDEIYQILYYMTMLVKSYLKELKINIETMTYYDFIFAKGKYSKSISGREAKLNLEQFTEIINGRHPLLGKDAVPLNVELGKDFKALVITGPNTGGKTVALKTVGLLTLMIQSGLHVPVDEGSNFGIYSEIFVDIGDGQSIEQSLSTFSSHMTNIMDILDVANKYALILLDELGAGTDPVEGEGIAIAVLERLYNQGAVVLATSHYAKVKNFASEHSGFENGRMEFDIKTLKPLYQLTVGKPGESNAFLIALQLGVDHKLIERAHQITYEEEGHYSSITSTTERRNTYKRAKKQKTSMVSIKENHGKKIELVIGDMVKVPYLDEQGIIFEMENDKGEVGVQIKGKKTYVPIKRVEPYISANELYPDDYDFDIIFQSKENRKKNKIMSKRHVEGLEIKLD
ncbi:endonuclease MutS2 [Vallitalea okinawensis]|uniref:endonuclease MutS2 n=1 Tax=Vallitalea okinawensis TaxID=2078660 RepID=UPI000CFB678B|nr:DNA mismatch repair protein [Vallitalea okinawensis]